MRVEVQRWSRRRDAEMQRWSRCRQCSVATSTSAGVDEVQRCVEVKVQSRYRNGGERWCKCRCRCSGAAVKRCSRCRGVLVKVQVQVQVRDAEVQRCSRCGVGGVVLRRRGAEELSRCREVQILRCRAVESC